MSKSNKNQEAIPQEVVRLVLKDKRRISSWPEWKAHLSSWTALYRKGMSSALPFDPRFNAINWAFDVTMLCREIVYGLMWMNAYAEFYKSTIKREQQPAHVDFQVSYFADNSMSRVDACKDKLALMVWSYYCAFNPEEKKEVLIFEEVKERLKYPIKYGLRLEGHQVFLKALELLYGEDFQRAKRFRDLKVHRREPRIEIYGVEPHHDLPYMLPVTQAKEIEEWKKSLTKQYPDAWSRERIERGCYINGVLFDRRTLKGRLWNFEDVRADLESCLRKLLRASSVCFRILNRRTPFRANPRSRVAPLRRKV